MDRKQRLEGFVKYHLEDCICAAASDVASLDYIEVDEYPYQYVVITFLNGYKKKANVRFDSEWGIIKDVMKTIEL